MTRRPARASATDSPPGIEGGHGTFSKRAFALSLAIHVLLLGVFPLLIANYRKNRRPEKTDIVFYRHVEDRPDLPPRPVAELRRPDPLPIEPDTAKVEPPRPKPRPEPPVEREPQVARIEPRPKPRPEPAPVPPPAPPRREVRRAELDGPATPRAVPQTKVVRTSVFGEERSNPVAAKVPERSVRTTGFAAADTVADPGAPSPKPRGRASVGGFAVATNGEEPPSAERRERVVAATGFAAESPPTDARDREARQRGSVKAGGFGDDGAVAPVLAANARTGSVDTGGFGNKVSVAEPRKREKPVPSPDTPVEILAKPKPVYTTEARELKVQGEVVLKVVFDASGQMRVLGVVEGLGHGLDEAAVDAARKIRFKPARRDGAPVDHAAVLRIVFQLV